MNAERRRFPGKTRISRREPPESHDAPLTANRNRSRPAPSARSSSCAITRAATPTRGHRAGPPHENSFIRRTSYRNVTAELAALDARINALLPPRYQHFYTSVSPCSLGSAGLRYGRDGRIAWDEIWTTFCDLALAGYLLGWVGVRCESRDGAAWLQSAVNAENVSA